MQPRFLANNHRVYQADEDFYIRKRISVSERWFLHQKDNFYIRKIISTSEREFLHQKKNFCIRKMISKLERWFLHQKEEFYIRKRNSTSKRGILHQKQEFYIKKRNSTSERWAYKCLRFITFWIELKISIQPNFGETMHFKVCILFGVEEICCIEGKQLNLRII